MAPSEIAILKRSQEITSTSTGVSWGAVIGGAFVAASLSLLLFALGAGFGLSAISPWSNAGFSASAVGATGIVWLIVTELIASSMGGYLTGRLRTKWQSVHNDEVHFRDTANGFLAWAVALVVSMSFLAAAATSMVGGAATATEISVTNGSAASGVGGNAYTIDRLFRSDHPGTSDDASVRAEADRILIHVLSRKEGADADTRYLAQLVGAKTGLNTADAERRVDQVVQDAKQAEDTVRKATAHLLLWISVVLLLGAFSASYAATVGGRQRDHVRAV